MSSILVTGTSSGFGAGITRTLLERGHTVFATMRDVAGRNAPAAAATREAAAAAPGRAHVIELDVTDDHSVRVAIDEALEAEGRIDAVVHNAGIGVGGVAEAFTVEQYRRILDTNVLGVQRVNRAVLPTMRAERSGLLVFVSSIMGRTVIPFAAPYTASKFALEGLAESYRYELAGLGIDVAIVEPGGFLTSFAENVVPPADEQCTAAYGAIALRPEEMWTGFMETLQAEGAPDPQLVADTVADLVDAAPGKRPLRTVVDPMMGGEGPRALNELSSQIQSGLLASLGLDDIERVQ